MDLTLGGSGKPGLRRRALLGLLALGAIGLLALGWRWLDGNREQAYFQQEPPTLLPTEQPTASSGTGPRPGASTGVASRSNGAGSWVVELCGVGHFALKVEPGASEPTDIPAHLLAHALDEARPRLLHALAQGDARMRGAALFMTEGRQGSELRHLALANSDPVLTMWALARCRADDAACRAPLATHWQALEPDNASAWLEDLVNPGKPAASTLAAMAAASRFTGHFGALAGTVAKGSPPDILPYLRHQLLSEAFGLEAAVAVPSIQPLSRICRAEPGIDPAVLASCKKVAQLMVDRGTEALTVVMGSSLGGRLGWPAERVAAARSAYDAYTRAADTVFASEQPLGCDAVNKTLSWSQDLALLGEMGAMRKKLAAASAPR